MRLKERQELIKKRNISLMKRGKLIDKRVSLQNKYGPL